MNSRPRLVLASASPRRAELLAAVGVRFDVRPTAVNESTRAHEPAHDYVTRLARTKAVTAFDPGAVVIAADTTVVVDDEILGKPTDAHDARSMLERLTGRAHEVLTGLAVAVARPASPSTATAAPVPPAISAEVARRLGGPDVPELAGEGPLIATTVVTTTVWMTELAASDIDWYVSTGEPMDKAGAYGIQGIAGMFVPYLHGSYQNVVGLPLADLDELLGDVGYRLLDWVGSAD
jgi:septum formation protein